MAVPERKSVNVKGVRRAVWDGLDGVQEAKAEGRGEYISKAIELRQRFDAGQLSSPEAPLSTAEVIALMDATSGLIQALVVAKQHRLALGRHHDVNLARARIFEALVSWAPPIAKKARQIGKEAATPSAPQRISEGNETQE